METRKRQIHVGTATSVAQTSTERIEEKTHRCWRRFMNARGIDRAYVPTAHGTRLSLLDSSVCPSEDMLSLSICLEHAANCLTHGCLIVPSFVAAQRLLSRAETPSQYWSSIIYGNALILLFSCSTLFHCSCFHPTYT